MRHALVVSQVALALVLLVGSGLMARSFARLRGVEPGFDPSGVLTFRVALPAVDYPGSADAARLYVRMLNELTTLPGVQAAGVASRLPLDGDGHLESAVWVEDHPTPPGGIPNIHPVARVTSGYFRALGIPLIAGRLFAPPDPMRSPREVVVSRALAERYWPGESAVGKRVRLDLRGPWSTVVGVVGNVRGASLEQPAEEMVYCPLAIASPGISVAGDTAWAPHDMAFVVRTAGHPEQITTAVRRVVRTLDPALPLYHLRPMTELVARAAARTSFTLLLLGLASAVALVLGAVGIYGVIAYMVSLRTREIGVRLALGAQPADVQRMVSRQGMAVAAIGVAVGLLGALALTRFLGALLFGVSPTDPVTLGGAAALLLIVAAVASWIPARRAAGVDPAVALRAE